MQVLADLESVSESVSVFACFAAYLTTCLCRIFDFIFIFYFTCCCRLSGRTGMKATMGANVWYQWMELTTQSGSHNHFTRNGSHTR
jgi:hypothetical protein